MKICFFGWKRAFDYYQIGGTESYVRRLASGLVDLGHEVTYVMYGASKRETVLPKGFNATLVYEQKFEDALKQLERRDFEIVVSIYVHPKYRPGFFLFRKRTKRRTIFSTILFSRFRSKPKLLLGSMDLHSYDSVFTVSERIKEQVARLGVRSEVLPPPVSDVFFEAAKKRIPSEDGRIRIGYIGRADYGKGFDIAVDIMRSLDKTKYSSSILTYSWPEKDYEIRPDDFHDWGIKLEITRYETYSDAIDRKIGAFLQENQMMIFPFRTLDTTIDTPLSLIESIVAGCKVVIPNDNGLISFFKKYRLEALAFKDNKVLAETLHKVANQVSFESSINSVNLEVFRPEGIAIKLLKPLPKGSENIEKN